MFALLALFTLFTLFTLRNEGRNEGIVPSFFFSSHASELTIRKVRGTAR